MTSQYEVLIGSYRVERSATTLRRDWWAYLAGAGLLVAPVIPGLALPLAVVSLAYFLIIFVTLAIKDVSPILARISGRSLEDVAGNLAYSGGWGQFMPSLARLSKKAIASLRARARWETRFFSFAEARPKVLPSSGE